MFEGAPILEPPLVQDQASRTPIATEGPPLDTRAVCPALSAVEQSKLGVLLAAARHHLAPEAAKVRAEDIGQQAGRIVHRTGCTLDAARHIVERQCGGVPCLTWSYPSMLPEFEGSTVADVLADPDRFIGATLSDPLEGPSYGVGKAKIMQRSDGTLWINSFAHGRTVYELEARRQIGRSCNHCYAKTSGCRRLRRACSGRRPGGGRGAEASVPCMRSVGYRPTTDGGQTQGGARRARKPAGERRTRTSCGGANGPTTTNRRTTARCALATSDGRTERRPRPLGR